MTDSIHLTQLLLDPTSRRVQTDLRDAHELHRTLMTLAPDGIGGQARATSGLLYRIETDVVGRLRILTQSITEPELHRLPDGYTVAGTTTLTGMLASLGHGVAVRYRILANPSKRAGKSDPRAGKIIAVPAADRQAWWAAKAATHGLDVQSVVVTQTPTIIGTKSVGGHRVQHASARFDGFGIVTDPDALGAAIRSGVGRGKSHGCGLLSLAPAS